MALFGWKKKEKVTETETKTVTNTDVKGEAKTDVISSFIFGVEDTFHLKDSSDLVVVGTVKGTVRVGDTVYISNPGSDRNDIVPTTIVGIEIKQGEKADEGSDTALALCIENGADLPIHKATVVYTEDKSEKEVHDVYITTLGDVFIIKQDMEISEEEMQQMSITDVSEIWRLFSWFQSELKKDTDQPDSKRIRAKIEPLAHALVEKILNADEIYCVFSKYTGEPYMFSRTIKREDSYLCVPPDIRIFTKAYVDGMRNAYSKDKYEIKKIENGADKKGIYNFLGSTFYLNGACGVQIIAEATSIAAQLLVEKPDYSKVPEQNVPITNPDLVRWMLLIGQGDEPNGEDEELIYKLYYRFVSKAMQNAKFLIPMKKMGDISEPDKDGKVVLKKDVNIHFPTMKGKHDRDAVCMFTDWMRLRMVYDEEWEGMVETVDGMINVFDCAINATKYPKAGCYIGDDMFEDMKRYWND